MSSGGDGGRWTWLEAAITATLVALVLTLGMLLAAVGVRVAELEFGLPYTLVFPLPVRALGACLAAAGALLGAWAVGTRGPSATARSTWSTFRKLFGGVKMDEREGRAEPFVAEGPYRFTRNPMYFGVSAVLLGAGALLESSTLVVWGALMAAFFWWFLIPFEERELSALFGEGYRLYAARVPKMLPYRKGYDREG